MKIRIQFIISTVVLGLILLLVSAAVIITNLWVENIHQQQELAAQIERQAYELGYLANDYLLYRERQQASRWESKFVSFSNDLSNIALTTPEQQVLLAKIKTNTQRQKTVFAEVRASIESAPQTPDTALDAKFIQVSWSRLEVQNQGLIFDASRLVWMLDEQEDQLRQMTSLLSFILIGVLGAFLLVNYRLTFRRVLQAIERLQAGTRIIGSGDLDFAIAVKNEDEIGELSHAFNQMTANLKQVTTSKVDLEKEVTERKQAEETLRQKEADLSEAQRIAHIGSWHWDARTDVTIGSDELLRIYGFDPATQVMPDFNEQRGRCYPVEDWERVNAAVQKTMETGIGYELDVRALRHGTTTIWVTTRSEVVRDAEGQITGLRGTAQDITERKRVEVELARLASFPERNPNPIVELEYSGEIVYLNPKARELFPNITHGHPLLAGLEQFTLKFEAGEAEMHYSREVQAGAVFYHQDIINIPEARHIRSYNIDITQRKQAEKALIEASVQKQAAQYARNLIEVSLDPMVTISPEGKVTDVNEATVKAIGLPRAELVGMDFSSFFTDPEKAERGYRQVFAQGYATDYPLTIRHHDGHLMDVLYNASHYKDANGKVQGVFAAARDVTVQKQAEAELKRHKENLEMLVKERTANLEETNRELARSNENLEQFAYVASHDLQEPLRTMSSYSQLLERRYRGRLDQDADEFIDFIVEAAARMQKLITDLLAYSRAGRETTDLVEVDCNKLVRRLVANMAATIETANGQVTFDRLPVILAHEASLTQLFQNLVGNALKFHGEQPPSIHLSARQEGGEWVFSVRDNGIGIEPQYRERIFIIFQRLHSRDKYPGTGIGLSICKKIVENQGGRIWMESEPGQGSTFTFTVPIQKQQVTLAKSPNGEA